MPDTPLFSVVIPFRNASTTLPETLASLEAQTEQDWEAFLINDASGDRSVELVQTAARKDPRLKLIDDPQHSRARGAAATRNLGIDAARGAYIALLDADDLWLPSKLAAQRVAFEAGADIVFSAYRRVDHSGRCLGIVSAPAYVTWADALSGNPIGCLTGAWRRAAFPQARMPLLDIHEDYAFWLTLLRTGNTATGLPEVLAEYRVHPGSRSANKPRAAKAVWDILGMQGVSLPCRISGFLRYASAGITRRL